MAKNSLILVALLCTSSLFAGITAVRVESQGKNLSPEETLAQSMIAQDPAPAENTEANATIVFNVSQSNGQECSCHLKERVVGSCKESDNKNLCEETTDLHCSCHVPDSEVVEEKEVHDQCECWDEHVENIEGELCFNNTIQHCSCQQTEAYTNGTNVTHQVAIEHGLHCNATHAEGQCGAFECHETHTLNYTETTVEVAPAENNGEAAPARAAAKVAQDPPAENTEANATIVFNVSQSNGQECSCHLKERVVGSCKESDNKNLCEETTDLHCSCHVPESEVVEEKEVHDQCECWDEHVQNNEGELCFNNTIQHCSCQQTEAYTNGTNVTHQVSIEHGLFCNASFAEGQCGAFECHESHTLNYTETTTEGEQSTPAEGSPALVDTQALNAKKIETLLDDSRVTNLLTLAEKLNQDPAQTVPEAKSLNDVPTVTSLTHSDINLGCFVLFEAALAKCNALEGIEVQAGCALNITVKYGECVARCIHNPFSNQLRQLVRLNAIQASLDYVSTENSAILGGSMLQTAGMLKQTVEDVHADEICSNEIIIGQNYFGLTAEEVQAVQGKIRGAQQAEAPAQEGAATNATTPPADQPAATAFLQTKSLKLRRRK